MNCILIYLILVVDLIMKKIYTWELHIKCPFGMINFANLFYYSAFFLLFIGLIAFFGTIHGYHYTISVNFHFYVQYFQ